MNINSLEGRIEMIDHRLGDLQLRLNWLRQDQAIAEATIRRLENHQDEESRREMDSCRQDIRVSESSAKRIWEEVELLLDEMCYWMRWLHFVPARQAA